METDIVKNYQFKRDYNKYPIYIAKNGKGSEMPYKEDLDYLYNICNMNQIELSEYFNTTPSTICRWLNRLNIKKSIETKMKKIRKTNLEKYGRMYNNSEKAKKTNLEKYGVENPSQNKNIQNKKYKTMAKNNSYGKSKKEDIIYNLLLEKYDNVIRQYKSKLYPFNCDFYIPNKEIYIEYQGFFTHGKEPYIGSDKQKDIIKKWMNKKSYFYNNAIKNWTISDVLKRQIAKENNLNYLEFFSLEEFMKWFMEN